MAIAGLPGQVVVVLGEKLGVLNVPAVIALVQAVRLVNNPSPLPL